MSAAKRGTINNTAGSILGYLHDGAKSGWDLATEIPRNIGDFWSITRSQIYRELHNLAAAGLIAAGDPGPRDRVVYQLTDEGRETFQQWIKAPMSAGGIRFPFLLQVRFGMHMQPDDLKSILRDFYLEMLQTLREYERERANIPDNLPREYRLQFSALDYGIENAKAAIRWYESLDEDIRGPLDNPDASETLP